MNITVRKIGGSGHIKLASLDEDITVEDLKLVLHKQHNSPTPDRQNLVRKIHDSVWYKSETWHRNPDPEHVY